MVLLWLTRSPGFMPGWSSLFPQWATCFISSPESYESENRSWQRLWCVFEQLLGLHHGRHRGSSAWAPILHCSCLWTTKEIRYRHRSNNVRRQLWFENFSCLKIFGHHFCSCEQFNKWKMNWSENDVKLNMKLFSIFKTFLCFFVLFCLALKWQMGRMKTSGDLTSQITFTFVSLLASLPVYSHYQLMLINGLLIPRLLYSTSTWCLWAESWTLEMKMAKANTAGGDWNDSSVIRSFP